MQFIEHEEALGRHCNFKPVVVYPVPLHPFPFLKLPLEIRNKIYYYALLEPGNDRRAIVRDNVVEIRQARREAPRQCTVHNTTHPSRIWNWGTEETTRLFRVCHQVSIEALEVFYSRFTFHFRYKGDSTFIEATLQRRLSVWARSRLGYIEFTVPLRSNPGPFFLRDEEGWHQTIKIIRQSLPNIRRANVYVSITGPEVPEHEVKSVVKRGLKMIQPMADLTGLVLDGSSNETAQRTRIGQEIREALRSGR